MAMTFEIMGTKDFGTIVDVVDGNTSTWFVVNGMLVKEWGTSLCYDVANDHSYIPTSRGKVSITSFENFGSDCRIADELAAYWRERARKAWEFVQRQ